MSRLRWSIAFALCAGLAWPSARVHSHLLAAMPPGVFPGVDDTEGLQFLETHATA